MKFRLEFGSLVYEFKLERKITLISDLSATGKTTLVNALNIAISGDNPIAQVRHEAKGIVVIPETMEANLEMLIRGAEPGSLIVVDEMPPGRFNRISGLINKKQCWFLIINRELLSDVHVSVKSVCRMETVNGVHRLIPLYKNMKIKPLRVICEGNGGEQLFYKHFAVNKSKVEGVDGNGDIAKIVLKKDVRGAAIIADGASMGHILRDFMRLREKKQFQLFLPESFEWVLLLSDYFDNDIKILKLRKGVEEVLDYRHSSAERYITAELLNRVPAYSKGSLPSFLYAGNKLDESKLNIIWKRIGLLDFSLLE